ncbi:MAG: hydrogenase maturation protease [Sulfolobales archaeon]|nr:hydrogenase maturation protease [Sulfolobales archaeon]MCX8199527.1 hydrogenase maturation protease [Sulfolobales archaeon]MDW8170480.1 hydrogenase maturation protease [Desulfurococcaceae archaeon]
MKVFPQYSRALEEEVCSYVKAGYLTACIGSPLRQDDRAGLELCRTLMEKGLPTVVCEYGLENCIEELINSNAKRIAIVDAVMTPGARPGDIVIINDLNELDNEFLVTTHSVPLTAIIKILQSQGMALETIILGIQVKEIGLGLEISSEVERAVSYMAQLIEKCVKENLRICF